MAERTLEVGDPKRPLLLTEDPDAIESEPRLAFFLDYWRKSRADATLPQHTKFVPKDVKSHLGWVIVADAVEDFADFRYRVVGSRVCDYFLGDGTGKTVREAFAGTTDELINGTIALYRLACAKRIPVRLRGPCSTHDGVFFPGYDALCLPYTSNGEHADRVVVVFTFNYQTLVAQRQSAALLRA